MSDNDLNSLIEYVKKVDEGAALNEIRITALESLLENYHPKLFFLYKKMLAIELQNFLKSHPNFFDSEDVSL